MQTMNGYMRPPGTTTLWFPSTSLDGPGRVISGLGGAEHEAAAAILVQSLADFQSAVGRCPPLVVGVRDTQQDWVHVIDDVFSPVGHHCEQWDEAAANAFNAASTTLMKLVRDAKGFTTAAVPWPSIPDKLSTLIVETGQLLTLYATLKKTWPAVPANLVAAKPTGRNWGAIIFGSALGVTLIGSLIYAASRS